MVISLSEKKWKRGVGPCKKGGCCVLSTSTCESNYHTITATTGFFFIKQIMTMKCGDLPLWSTVMRTTVLYYFICNAIYIQNVCISGIILFITFVGMSKNILYSNFMIIYRLCKVLSFT
jgi:hypothetical protein